MSEFEIVSLALRESALWVAVAQGMAAVAIGVGQIAVVWYGIRAMQQAGDRRERGHERRHAETMRQLDIQARGLEALIERTGTAAD